MRFLPAASAVLLISGCAYLSPPAENPIIEQHARNRINTFAVVPARRVVLIKAERANDDNSPLVVCGEAPADVTDNIASTFAASLAASAAKGNDISAGISRSLETFGQLLFKRSQGLQLFRDQSYYLCQARMNNFITDAEYKTELKAAFNAILPLIDQEIRTNAAALQPPASAASQPRVTFIPLTSSTPITSVEIDPQGKVKSTVSSK
jgi:hypothetical protein